MHVVQWGINGPRVGTHSKTISGAIPTKTIALWAEGASQGQQRKLYQGTGGVERKIESDPGEYMDPEGVPLVKIISACTYRG